MAFSELFRLAFTALRAHKLRSLLTTLGIVIAVWTIVSVVSVITGMNDYVRTKIFTLSPDVFVVTKFGIITSREAFLEAIKRKDITKKDVETVGRLCESCADIGVTWGASLPVRSAGRRISGVDIQGTLANEASLENLDIEAGRFFTEQEEEHGAPVAVIGSEIREELYPHLDPIGRTVWVGGFPLRIIGLLTKQGSVLGQSRDVIVYTPLRTLEKSFGRRHSYDLLIKASGGIPGISLAQDEVTSIFRSLRHTPAKSPDPIGIVTAEMIQLLWKQISASTFIFVIVISGISLVVGAIVVANIMLVSVVERTKEIGLRLALGARKRDISRQFLVEAVALSFAGGVIGTLAGMVTAWIVDTQSPMPAAVDPKVVAGALFTAGLTGVLAGFFPARKAANLPPIEALRYE
jgi:putative ABC transport system permease protein